MTANEIQLKLQKALVGLEIASEALEAIGLEGISQQIAPIADDVEERQRRHLEQLLEETRSLFQTTDPHVPSCGSREVWQ